MSALDTWDGGAWLYCVACGFDIWSEDGQVIPPHDWEFKQHRFTPCRAPQADSAEVRKFIRDERTRRALRDYEDFNERVRRVRGSGRR